MPKLYHKDATSFSFAGQTYDADKKGVFNIPDEAVPAALEFGFFAKSAKATPEPESAPVPEVAQPEGEAEVQAEPAAEAAEPAQE